MPLVATLTEVCAGMRKETVFFCLTHFGLVFQAWAELWALSWGRDRHPEWWS